MIIGHQTYFRVQSKKLRKNSIRFNVQKKNFYIRLLDPNIYIYKCYHI